MCQIVAPERTVATCGTSCLDDSECGSANDGCISCNQSTKMCSEVPQVPQCGNTCSTDSDCEGAENGCTTCGASKTCIVAQRSAKCISDEDALKNAVANDSKEIILCNGGSISIYEESKVEEEGVTIKCESAGSCTLDQKALGRFFTFSKGKGIVDGIVFENGYVSGQDGGALLMYGVDNQVINCEFNHNSASGGRGGAIYMNAGSVSNNKFMGNTASQCADAMIGSVCSLK